MKHGSLFSGIGGFDLAAEWMNWQNIFHCEWNEFGRKVLNHYWPNSISYEDITKVDFRPHRGSIDIISGGFPCQPYSAAGKRLGTADDRHLWPEMLRAIQEIQPTWVVAENVLGLVNWNDGLVFHEVQADLEAEGHEVQPYVLPAASVNAPHQRQRVWFVAYRKGESSREELQQRPEKGKLRGCDSKTDATDTDSQLHERRGSEKRPEQAKRYFSTSFRRNTWQNFPTQSPICGGDDGLPTELDNITFPKWRNESIKAYGNAIVPQVALQIFKAIDEYETANN
jgi:DNA (cytosine-5)-methyltransferase 1